MEMVDKLNQQLRFKLFGMILLFFVAYYLMRQFQNPFIIIAIFLMAIAGAWAMNLRNIIPLSQKDLEKGEKIIDQTNGTGIIRAKEMRTEYTLTNQRLIIQTTGGNETYLLKDIRRVIAPMDIPNDSSENKVQFIKIRMLDGKKRPYLINGGILVDAKHSERFFKNINLTVSNAKKKQKPQTA